MKRFIILAAVVAMAMAMVPMTALAKGPGPKATGGVQWMGGATSDIPHDASFNAQGTVDDAKGRVHVRGGTPAGTFEFRGVVTCYTQANGEAFFSGEVTRAEGVNSDRPYFVINVRDNGEGNGSAPDQIRTVRRNADPECEELGSAYREIDEGNIQVHSQ